MDIEVSHYDEARGRIQDGDLLIWTKDQNSTKSNLFLKLVRLFTQSEFAHVGVAYWIGHRLYVIEATIPEIRIYPLSKKEEFYHLPMDIDFGEAQEDWLMARIGKSYSFMDCVRAYFGYVHSDNDKYQCAELCAEFYRDAGVELGQALTPNQVVYQALSVTRNQLALVKPD